LIENLRCRQARCQEQRGDKREVMSSADHSASEP
jgi:hypothetical protein